jgi:pyrimidine deaminase RibD-like protein
MDHYELARLAVDKAKLCPVKADTTNPPPRVAIVIAREGELLGWAAKGVGGEYVNNSKLNGFIIEDSEHAEQALLTRLKEVDLAGVIALVTLEPCTRRKRGLSCAELIVSRGIREVHVGNCDPNPDIGALAWRIFLKHGVRVRDFPADLRNEARRDNAAFFDKFIVSLSNSGNAAFDYSQNAGERILGDRGREFRTRWTPRGIDTIYALDYKNNVCIAKNCSSFSEIDDAGRWFEDSHYTKPVSSGEIVIFRNEHGFALIRVVSVRPAAPGVNAELKFEYTLRYLKSSECPAI